jgi:hypothetical protein
MPDDPAYGEEQVEATPGIEPGYADLQSAASPLRHVALVGNRALELRVPRLPDAPAIQEPSARSNGFARCQRHGFARISLGFRAASLLAFWPALPQKVCVNRRGI